MKPISVMLIEGSEITKTRLKLAREINNKLLCLKY